MPEQRSFAQALSDIVETERPRLPSIDIREAVFQRELRSNEHPFPYGSSVAHPRRAPKLRVWACCSVPGSELPCLPDIASTRSVACGGVTS